ncbi:hypothetical protein QO005_000515 [Rhizobium paknamense]|uniref:Uncharacterized protein n=1 Tax=Rhizobium paknamense TaxID=1206817 RepID=A0ABU0I7L6_9HYPH|nr:hypothetical protein [Rhizobium paknamense]
MNVITLDDVRKKEAGPPVNMRKTKSAALESRAFR